MRLTLLTRILFIAVQANSLPLDITFASLDDIFQYGVEKFIDTLNNVRATVNIIIDQNKNSLQRSAWEQIAKRLDKVNISASELRDTDERVRELWSIEIEESANEIVDQLNEWAEGTYQEVFNPSADENSHKLVIDLLNDYVNTYTGYINQCADEVKHDLFAYDKKVQKVADRYRNVMNTLMNQVQKCVHSSSSICQRAAALQLRQFSEASREFKGLSLEGDGLNVSFEQTDCVNQTKTEYENEQSELITQVTDILYNVENNQDNGNDNA